VSFLERLLEDPARMKRLKRGSIGLLVVIAGVEIAAGLMPGEHHHHFAFEGWPAFGSAYGFLSCVVIILVSKFIGKKWLMRNEDHYSHEWQEDGDDA
jgi:di/tricarboxylate transporter